MVRLVIAWTLLLNAAVATAQAADVYKWVDEHGHTHYGDKPADDSALTLDVEPVTPATDPTLEQRHRQRDKLLRQFADERRKQAEEDRQLAAEQAQQQRQCERLRKRLWQYEHSPYLYETDAEGKRRILAEDERTAEQDKLRQYLKKNCR